MKYTDYRRFGEEKKYLTAIIICNEDGKIVGKKYRNIHDGKENDFIAKVAIKFPGALYVNFYYRRYQQQSRGEFKHRIHLQ